MPDYYTKKGVKIHNPTAYAKTGAPMYKSRVSKTDINAPTSIYKLNLESGKKYIGKTKDIDRRMDQHFSGGGAEVTKKFKPIDGEIIDECPGFFSDKAEQKHTDKNIKKYGYNNVRGGKYVNSKTLHDSGKKKTITCFKCGKTGHYANQCYSNTKGNNFK
jgi:predicted GIY-YIG superfamily endonuclease